MVVRLTRSASVLLMGIVLAAAAAGSPGATETAGAEEHPASIELRKSFRFVGSAGHRTSPREQRGDSGAAAPAGPGDRAPIPLGGVAAALGEDLQSSGTLHLPDVGEGGVVLQGSTTPILETAAGRHLIIDRGRTIAPGLVEAIPRRWPGFSVVQPPAGSNLRDVLGLVLGAAGYDSVTHSAPLLFGRGVTLKITPDFVVLRSENDLLAGETRAISVVDPGAALPPELCALAGEFRVRIFELTPDGAPAGNGENPWRDPAGRVTTMESSRLAPILGEIAGVLGLPVDRGDAAIVLSSSADPLQAIGALLGHFGLPAIGPAVEFYRAPAPGSARRFVINIPGWLTETGGRRLLITGNALPPLVRLYLTREGIDIFEYRVAGR